MESLPTTKAPGKGLWLTSREVEALGAAKRAAIEERQSHPGPDGAGLAAIAQADALALSSWRARYTALAEAVMQPGLVDPGALAMAITENAPAAHHADLVPSEDGLRDIERAARRLYKRACAADRAGAVAVTLSADEACEHGNVLYRLVAALRELT